VLEHGSSSCPWVVPEAVIPLLVSTRSYPERESTGIMRDLFQRYGRAVSCKHAPPKRQIIHYELRDRTQQYHVRSPRALRVP
jgi:hypothetical protein